jgi:phosphoglucomutase
LFIEHFNTYGRYFIQRHDYEGVDKEKATGLYKSLKERLVGKSQKELIVCFVCCVIFIYFLGFEW